MLSPTGQQTEGLLTFLDHLFDDGIDSVNTEKQKVASILSLIHPHLSEEGKRNAESIVEEYKKPRLVLEKFLK